MQEKAQRIKKQREGVQKYHDFLENVRLNNTDQYGSITAIMERYKTLSGLQENLKKELESKESLLKTMKGDFGKY